MTTGSAIMRALIAVLAPSLLACAPIEPRQFVGPSGNVAYSMECSGFGRTLEACYLAADELCPGGYVVISEVASPPEAPTPDSETSSLPTAGTVPAPPREMIIECNAN